MTSQKDLLQRLDDQQKVIDLLMKAADKSKIARFAEKSAKGKKVKISLYDPSRFVGDEDDQYTEPKVVVKWKMLKDEVRVDKMGVQENQVVRVWFEGDEDVNVGVLERQLAITKDPEKREEKKKKIEQAHPYKDLSYRDFYFEVYDNKVEVPVVEERERDGNKIFVVEYNEKQYALPIQFIN